MRLVFALWPEVGGLSGMAGTLNQTAPGWTSITGIGWTDMNLFSWHLVWFIAYFTRIEFVTKVYIAKDETTAERAVAWGLLLVLIFFSVTVFLGGAARVLVWDQLTAAKMTPDMALPLLMSKYMSPFMQALALAGIASAAMSTVSSLLLLSGAAIAHDILRRSVFEPRGIVKSEAFYLGISRLTLLGVGVVSTILAFFTPAMILIVTS